MPEAAATHSISTEPASPAADSTVASELAAPSDKEYSVEDFADLADDQRTAEEGEAAAPAEDEAEAPAAEPGLEPSAEPPQAAAPKGARDYSQFDPETAAILKTMPNKGFAWATKMLETRKAETAALTETRAEVEKLKSGALPESWHAEPEAYKIAPQYVQHESEFMKAQSATHKYAEAIDALAMGEAFEVPGSDGKPISIDPAKLDERGRIKLKSQLESAKMHFYEQQREHAAAANQFRDGFKAKYTQAEAAIARETDRLFPLDPKTQLKEVEFEKQILGMFPPEFRNHPASKLAARQGVYMNKLMTLVAQKDAEIKALKGLKADTRLAGGIPKRNGAAPAGAPSADADKMMDLKDFEG